MSEKNFDQQIKNKLESVQPPYSPAAWQSFQKLLPMPRHIVFLKNYGSWLYNGSATITLVITLFFYFQEHNQNEQLHKEINNLRSSSSTQKRSSPSNLLAKPGQKDHINKLLTEATPDTFYVIRKVFVDKGSTGKEPFHLNGTVSNTFYAQKNITDGPNTPSTSFVTAPKQTIAATFPMKDKEALMVDTSGTQAIHPLAEKDSTPIGIEQKTIEAGTEIPQPDSAHVKALHELTEADTTKKAASSLLLPIRLGVSGSVSKGQEITFGPTIEYFIRKRISLESGILLSPAHQENYSNFSDFSQKTGLDFEEEYPGSVSRHTELIINKYNTLIVNRRDSLGNNPVLYDTVYTVKYDSTYYTRIDSVHSISRSTRLVKLPVRINYYYPITPNLSILLAAGSNLEVSVSQSVSFKNISPNEERYVQFERRIPPIIFSNILFGVGAEYRYKKLNFQLLPYYYHQFKSTNYLNSKSTVGLNISLKYNFTD